MKLESLLKSIEGITECKVVIMEGSKEKYNNYLNESRVYEYLRQMKVKSMYASDADLVIEIEGFEGSDKVEKD